jgi:hypothetical protein
MKRLVHLLTALVAVLVGPFLSPALGVTIRSGAQFVGSGNQDTRPLDWSGELRMLDPDLDKFTHLLMKLPGRTVTDPKYNLFEDQDIPLWSQINGGTLTSGGTTWTVDDGTIFYADARVIVSRTGEIAKVSSVSTNDLTVVRAQQGTSAAALLDNDYVLVLGEIIYEMDTVGIVRTTQPVTVFNYTEIFRKAHSISGTALATKKRTIADDVRDKKIALRNMRRDMEHAFRFGVKEQTGSGSTTQRHTGGFESYITTNVFQANGQVTEPFLLGVCKEIFTYGTATKKLVLAGPELMAQLAALGMLADTVISADDKDRNWLGMDIRQFISPFGVLDFVWDKALTKGYADRGHIIDIEHVRQTTLQGRELDYKRIEGRQSGDTTFLDGTIGEFLTERGFDLDNEPTCGVIKGTTLAS